LIPLVDNGRTCFEIEVRPPQDAERLGECLFELVDHLSACLPDGVRWFDRSAGGHAPSRLVLLFDPTLEMPREAFEIVAEDGEVRLVARSPAGLAHATHHFLEEAFGVRWLFPGELGTVTPRAQSVSWPLGSSRHEPSWAWRRIWVGGAFFDEDDALFAELKRGGVRPETLRALHRWQGRQRLEGLRIADGHRWSQICPPHEYGSTRPELFALADGRRDTEYFDGKHRNQPCTTNPETIELTARYVIDYFRSQPEMDGFSLAMNDSEGFCECEACLALDARCGRSQAGGTDAAFDAVVEDVQAVGGPGTVGATDAKPPITDRVFTFANEVARRVGEVFPEKLLVMLIYGRYRRPPKTVRLAPNVIAQFCAFTWAHADEEIFARDLRTLEALQGSAERLGIYDYFVNGKMGSLPRGIARVAGRTLKAYHGRGCRYFTTQAGLDFATGGLAYYFAARLLWDIDARYEDVLEDYCRSGFGPAAEPVRRYLHAFTERWERKGTGPRISLADDAAVHLYDRPWRQQRRAELLDARQHAAGDEAVLARVAFLAEGLDFVDRFAEAAEAIQALLDAGAPGEWHDADALARWTREHCRADGGQRAVERAVTLRDALAGWIDEHADGFAISAMWARYQWLRSRLGRWTDIVASASDG
jgi:hypothetical protein